MTMNKRFTRGQYTPVCADCVTVHTTSPARTVVSCQISMCRLCDGSYYFSHTSDFHPCREQL